MRHETRVRVREERGRGESEGDNIGGNKIEKHNYIINTPAVKLNTKSWFQPMPDQANNTKKHQSLTHNSRTSNRKTTSRTMTPNSLVHYNHSPPHGLHAQQSFHEHFSPQGWNLTAQNDSHFFGLQTGRAGSLISVESMLANWQSFEHRFRSYNLKHILRKRLNNPQHSSKYLRVSQEVRRQHTHR